MSLTSKQWNSLHYVVFAIIVYVLAIILNIFGKGSEAFINHLIAIGAPAFLVAVILALILEIFQAKGWIVKGNGNYEDFLRSCKGAGIGVLLVAISIIVNIM